MSLYYHFCQKYAIIDIMIILIDNSPQKIALNVASNVKQRRLELNLTQAGFAKRSGMAIATYRVFERTGRISLQNLILIGVALGSLEDFSQLFQRKSYATLEEALRESKSKRKRGTVS
jgi:transcriptional regulator with XRE-family HTH domain